MFSVGIFAHSNFHNTMNHCRRTNIVSLIGKNTIHYRTLIYRFPECMGLFMFSKTARHISDRANMALMDKALR